jgi:hypothetical protein
MMGIWKKEGKEKEKRIVWSSWSYGRYLQEWEGDGYIICIMMSSERYTPHQRTHKGISVCIAMLYDKPSKAQYSCKRSKSSTYPTRNAVLYKPSKNNRFNPNTAMMQTIHPIQKKT